MTTNTITQSFDPSLKTSDEIKIDLYHLEKEHTKLISNYQNQLAKAQSTGEAERAQTILENIDRANTAYEAVVSTTKATLEKAIENEKLAPKHTYDQLSFDARHMEIAKKAWIRNGGSPEDFEENWIQLKNKLLIELTTASLRGTIAGTKSGNTKL